MLLQFDITGMEWILGVGLMFGLALVMTMVKGGSAIHFLAWLMIFCGFVVSAGLLELWVLVLCLVVFTIALFIEFKNGGSVQ